MDWKTGLSEVAPDVFAYLQWDGGFCISNAGFIRGKNGSTVIDALFAPSMTRAFMGAFRRVAQTPVRRLINTHHHVDHTAGNYHFEGIDKIAHLKAREAMIERGFPADRLAPALPHLAPEFPEVQIDPPNVVFEGERILIDDGARRIDLLHWGTAHTVGDVLVHLPEERVLFAGDVAFFGVTPLAFEGHVSRWMDAIDRVLGMEAVDVIVPGHGPTGTKEDLRELRGYFDLLKSQSARAHAAGVDALELARTIDLGPYAGWTEAERVLPNIMRLYQEFEGTLDEPLDLGKVMREMVSLRR